MDRDVEHAEWSGAAGRSPWPVGAALVLVPALLAWTLPQTIVGLCLAAWQCLRGTRLRIYAFGPFLFLVAPVAPPAASGISLGLVVFAARQGLLTHEFCHLYTGLWLSWLYLPVYGLEYLLLGHDRSFHERITCRFEARTGWAWKRLI